MNSSDTYNRSCGIQPAHQSLKPGAKLNSVAARYGFRANHLPEWRSRAWDGKLVLPAVEDAGPSFAPIVLPTDGGATPLSALPTQPVLADPPSSAPIEIAIGQITIRLDGTTAAARIAEIVLAIGSRT